MTPVTRIRRASALDHSTGPTLVIHDTRIALTSDADVSGLIEEILTGVRAGGGVVHVRGRFGQHYDVIVTPSTQAIICHEPARDDDHSTDGLWLTSVDLDHP